MFGVSRMLPVTHALAHAPMPIGVRAIDVCWPLGGAAASTPSNQCRQRRRAWTINGVLPPTFAERDLTAWSSGASTLRVDSRNRRLSATCHGKGEHQVSLARWPALSVPWLDADDAAASALPPLAPGCLPIHWMSSSPFASLASPMALYCARRPTARALRVTLQAMGASSEVQWLLDGRLQGASTVVATW